MASHKTRLQLAASALALAVAGGVAAAQEPPSPPPPGCPNPEPRHACHILASPDGDNVQAEGFSPRSPVTFEIYNTPGGRRVFGPVTKKTDANGNQEVCLSNPHSCLEGDYGDLLTTGSEVKVTDVASGTVKTLVTTPLSVDAVDAAADTVSGTARPGDTVEVNGQRPNFGTETVADANGAWTAHPGADLTGTTFARAEVFDDDGDETAESQHPGCPPNVQGLGGSDCSIDVSLVNDSVHGNGTPNSEVTFEIFDAPHGRSIYGPVTLKTDSKGATGGDDLIVSFTAGIDLVPGNYIVMTDHGSSTTKTLELAPVSIDSVDAAANVVAGRAPPGATVAMWGTTPKKRQVVADSSGNWMMDYNVAGDGEGGPGSAGPFDFSPDDFFTARVFDDDLDVTSFERGALPPDCQSGGETICGTAASETISVAAGATAAATGRAATAAKFAKFRRVKAGGGDDVVLVTIGASGRADVNTGTGATDRVLVRPGVGRSAAGRVDVHGRSSRMVIALPAHAGSLRVDVTGTRGPDRVTTRKLGGRGASRGGYRIAGGPGNDYLAGGDGRDTLIGGPGRDTCVAGRGDVVESCEIVKRR